jgi:Xaa-Pro aminopeptidase
MGLDVHDMEDLGETLVGYDDEIRRDTRFGYRSLRFGKRLEPGHVVTVEPGIYFIPQLIAQWEREGTAASFIRYNEVRKYLDFGGIRLEDNIVITETAARLVYEHRLPVAPEEIAAVVQGEG